MKVFTLHRAHFTDVIGYFIPSVLVSISVKAPLVCVVQCNSPDVRRRLRFPFQQKNTQLSRHRKFGCSFTRQEKHGEFTKIHKKMFLNGEFTSNAENF